MTIQDQDYAVKKFLFDLKMGRFTVIPKYDYTVFEINDVYELHFFHGLLCNFTNLRNTTHIPSDKCFNVNFTVIRLSGNEFFHVDGSLNDMNLKNNFPEYFKPYIDYMRDHYIIKDNKDGSFEVEEIKLKETNGSIHY